MTAFDDEGCDHDPDMSCCQCWLGEVRVGDRLIYEHFDMERTPCTVRFLRGFFIIGVVFDNGQPAELHPHDFVKTPHAKIAEAVGRR